MFTTWDKAWVSALVSFASMTALQFWNIDIGPEMQTGLAALLVGVFTWIIPNKD